MNGSYKSLDNEGAWYRTPLHLHRNNGLGADGGAGWPLSRPGRAGGGTYNSSGGCWCERTGEGGVLLLDSAARTALPTDRRVRIRYRIVRDIINGNRSAKSISTTAIDLRTVPLPSLSPRQERDAKQTEFLINVLGKNTHVSFACREEERTSIGWVGPRT